MGNNLRAFRTDRRWRQRDLADQVQVLSRRVLDQTLSVTERTVSRWERGDTPSLPAQRVLAAVFDTTPEDLGFPVPDADLAATPAGAVERPAADGLDAFELVARLTRSDASNSTLEMLANRVDRLCRDYPVRPADELLAESHRWLDRTLAMTEHRLTLTQHRETLVQAGWLSALVACLTYDTGDATGAESWREATAQLGHETGHAELSGWSFEIAAWMALTSNRPLDAARYASAGRELDRTSSVSVQLAAQHARACAQLGDRAGAEQAMASGRAVLARLPAPADPDHHFVIDPAKADFYAVDVYRSLGMAEPATEYAHRVLAYSEQPDGTIRSPMRRSEALLTLGTIAARDGRLDAALSYGLTAFDAPRKCLPSLLAVATDLDAALARYRSHTVEQWREALSNISEPLELGDSQDERDPPD